MDLEALAIGEKDRVKTAIVDEVLNGRDIRLGQIGVGADWQIYAVGIVSRGVINELFRWGGNASPTGQQMMARPLDLNEALGLVEEFWKDRRPGAWIYDRH